jgi:two-component system, OmpR family, phosphate regulon response regulator PhoB
MSARILVVDEDLAMLELVAVNLARAGHQVVRAVDADGAHSCMRAELPDLVVLEWILPGMSGIDLVRAIRSEPRTRSVPLIMLTARLDVRDKIAGLEAGADDYLTKPFSPRELLARIAAVLRRRAPQSTYDAVEVGGLRIEPIARRVTVDGSEVELGATEFRLLHFLMTHANRVHSRAQLLDRVWGDHFFGNERTVDVHIRRLRAAIRKCGHDRLIQTVRGTGYSFWAQDS